VRAGKWKAVRRARGPRLELYDLENDPGETNDVAAWHPGLVTRAENYLKDARADSPSWPVPPK
jgi:hypothetical protein